MIARVLLKLVSRSVSVGTALHILTGCTSQYSNNKKVNEPVPLGMWPSFMGGYGEHLIG